MCNIICYNDIYDLKEYFEDIDENYNQEDPFEFIFLKILMKIIIRKIHLNLY